MNKSLGTLWIIGFIATIFAANWAISRFGIVPVGFGLSAPAGVYFAGLAFTLRDLVHDQVGVRGAMITIIIAGILSYLIAPSFAVASACAFLFSEAADLAVYTPLRERRPVLGILCSNIVGSVIDSILFLWIAFHSLEYLPGQVVGKLWITAATVLIVTCWRTRGDLPVWRHSSPTT